MASKENISVEREPSNVQINETVEDSQKSKTAIQDSGQMTESSENVKEDLIKRTPDPESQGSFEQDFESYSKKASGEELKCSNYNPGCELRGITGFTPSGLTKDFRCSRNECNDGRERTFDIHGNTLFIRPNLSSLQQETNPLFQGFQYEKFNASEPRLAHSQQKQQQQRQQKQQQQQQQKQQQQHLRRLRNTCKPDLNKGSETCGFNWYNNDKSCILPRRSKSKESGPCSKLSYHESRGLKKYYGVKCFEKPCTVGGDGRRMKGKSSSNCTENPPDLPGRFPVLTRQVETTRQGVKTVKPRYVVEKELEERKTVKPRYVVKKELEERNNDAKCEGRKSQHDGNKTRSRNWMKDPYLCMGPSQCNKTRKERQIDEEEYREGTRKDSQDTDAVNRKFLAGLRSVHNKLINQPMDYRPITLEVSLQPWLKSNSKNKKAQNKETLHTPFHLSKHCDTEFSEFVTDRLYPGWRDSRPSRTHVVVQSSALCNLRTVWRSS